MQPEQMDKLGDQAPETEGEDDLYTFRYLRYLSKRAGIPVQESVYIKFPAKNPADWLHEIRRTNEKATFLWDLRNGKTLTKNIKNLKPPRPINRLSITCRGV
jgi:hypothetical protein